MSNTAERVNDFRNISKNQLKFPKKNPRRIYGEIFTEIPERIVKFCFSEEIHEICFKRFPGDIVKRFHE